VSGTPGGIIGLPSFLFSPPSRGNYHVQVVDIHRVYVSSLFLVYMIRFQSHGLLSCPLLCLMIGSLLARYFQVELATLSHPD